VTNVLRRLDARGPQLGAADERGSVTTTAVGIIVIIFLAIGLVGDGGSSLTAQERAANIARAAARAGADNLTDQSLRGDSSSRLALNPAAATAAARRTLKAAGATGDVTVSATRVTVTARSSGRTYVLRLFGVRSFTQTATASATPVSGIVAAQPENRTGR
jgi:Flp pilus assembly protein TadG